MDWTIPDFAWDDLDSLAKAFKTRKTRLVRGTMTSESYYAGIKKDLRKSAAEGRIHRYFFCLKMYEETITEVQGKPYFQGLVDRGIDGLNVYLHTGHFRDRIPF